MRKSLMTVAKWAWAACVLVAVAVILWRSRDDIVRMLQQVSPWMLAASFLLTCAAKFLLGENARIAALHSGIRMDYPTAAKLYNLSQLGKYIPGSIWQFVGRAAAYRALGAGYAPIRDSLMTESLWVIAGAAIFGALLSGAALLRIVDQGLPHAVRWWFVFGFGAVTIALAIMLFWKRKELTRYLRSAVPTPRAVIVQAGIWTLLGLAFWVLARACGIPAHVGFVIGLFAAAYAIGFLVPIAPAGLGVRDAILTLGLLPYASAGEAVAVTAVARLIYLSVELVLVATQDFFFRRFAAGGTQGSAP